MNTSRHAVERFDRRAAQYHEKTANLTLYDDTNRLFCDLLPKRAQVLDAACGPGNITKFLLARRPDLQVLGIDMAPRMIEIAKANNPSADFAVRDCRDLCGLGRRFDGIVCGFGFPYLSIDEVARFIADSAAILNEGGMLYVSTVAGSPEASGFVTLSFGDRVFFHYHAADRLLGDLAKQGFETVDVRRERRPSSSGEMVTELLIVARKVP